MDGFPQGWFYIQSEQRPRHVLTVVNKSWEPGTRIELRPFTREKQQQWSFDRGFLINRHSGCVVTAKGPSVNQTLIQARRLPVEQADTQLWQYDGITDQLLKLRSNPAVCLAAQEQIPRTASTGKDDQEATGSTGWLFVDELAEQIKILSLETAADENDDAGKILKTA